MKLYINNAQLIAGITLKEQNAPEQNNMALHVCEDAQTILKNREKLATKLSFSTQQFVYAQQTHSANFYKVEKKDTGRGTTSLTTAIPNTDALYTYESGIVLTAFSADCVPILLHNTTTGVIGAVHSGWQGTVKEIMPNLLQKLIVVEKNPPEAFHIYINPALSQQKFEVDRDVYDKFKALGYADDFMYLNEQTAKYHIDNQLTVKKQCELAGIPTKQIYVDDTCTFLSDAGFSYRQDKKAGRHMSFITKKVPSEKSF